MSAIVYEFDDFKLLVKTKQLVRENGKLIRLTPKLFNLLLCLIESEGNDLSKRDLLNIVWKDVSVSEASLTQDISVLRRKLKDPKENPRIIKTIPGFGYCFIAEVKKTFEDVAGKSSILNWQHLILYIAFALTIALLTSLAIFTGNENNENSDVTRVTVEKAVVHLDLNDGWNDLSNADLEKNEKSSRAVVNFNYQVRKHFSVDTFAQRAGTTSLIPPKWENVTDHPISKVEDVKDDAKKCSVARFSYMLNFDISKELVGKPFDLGFKIYYFNAHNKKRDKWQAFYIHRPIERLEFKISFPKNLPYPKEIHLIKKKDCSDIGERLDNKPTSPANFVENREENTIIWYVENPTVNNIYVIEWDRE